MKVRSYHVGLIGTNCYLLMDDDAGVCALIDPGDEGEYLAGRVKECGCELKMIPADPRAFRPRHRSAGYPEGLSRRAGLHP